MPIMPPNSTAERETNFPGSPSPIHKCHMLNLDFQIPNSIQILPTKITPLTPSREKTTGLEGGGRRCRQENALAELNSASVQRRQLEKTRVLLPGHARELLGLSAGPLRQRWARRMSVSSLGTSFVLMRASIMDRREQTSINCSGADLPSLRCENVHLDACLDDVIAMHPSSLQLILDTSQVKVTYKSECKRSDHFASPDIITSHLIKTRSDQLGSDKIT